MEYRSFYRGILFLLLSKKTLHAADVRVAHNTPKRFGGVHYPLPPKVFLLGVPLANLPEKMTKNFVGGYTAAGKNSISQYADLHTPCSAHIGRMMPVFGLNPFSSIPTTQPNRVVGVGKGFSFMYTPYTKHPHWGYSNTPPSRW